MTDRVLALDIALQTGWAVDKPSGGDTPIGGCFVVDGDGGDAHGRAGFHWRREVRGLIALHRPDLIAYEAPLPERSQSGGVIHGLDAAQLLLGLSFLCQVVAFEAGLDVYACDIGSTRAHFVGSKFAKKADVVHRCRVLGWYPKTEDEADAMAVWDYAKSSLRAGEVLARAEVGARA